MHISPHEHLHEMCISPVWGSPAPDTLDDLPHDRRLHHPARGRQGHARAGLQAGETLRATLHAEVDTGWREDADPGRAHGRADAQEDGPFVLFSGHHDTWYYGVMDNGSANATMLEVARLCAPAARGMAAWAAAVLLVRPFARAATPAPPGMPTITGMSWTGAASRM